MKKIKANTHLLLEYARESKHQLDLNLLNEGASLERELHRGEINRPGMNLFGFFDHFAYERLQIMGRGETTYLNKLHKENHLESISKLFEYEIPAFVFTHNEHPPEGFLEMATKAHVPVLLSKQPTSVVISRLGDFYNRALAPKVILNGVMMEIYGMGVLLEGEKGAGKSECALELIERGHRFIADDVVDVRLEQENRLIASSSKVIAHHMEIRGIGIINIAHLFGVGSIRNEKRIDLVIEIEHLDRNKKYDRIGMEIQYKKILDVNVPVINIPIQPGTNIPILVETGSMNHRLKSVGYNPAKEFNKKLNQLIERGEDIF